MSKPTIATLCLTCKRQYEEAGFTVKTYPGPPTTEKKTKCQQTKNKNDDNNIFKLFSKRQYIVIL